MDDISKLSNVPTKTTVGTGKHYVIKQSLLNLLDLTNWSIIINDSSEEYKAIFNSLNSNRIIVKSI